MEIEKGSQGWGKIYYNPYNFPAAIRIISRKLQIDHTFNPMSEQDCYTIAEFKQMVETGVFDDVRILPEEDSVYYVDINGRNEYINQWFSLKDVYETKEVFA